MKGKMMKLIVTDEISEQDGKKIENGVMNYNKPWFDRANSAELGVFACEEDGEKVGGLTGYTHGEWLFVKWLWVSESQRGRDLGSSILAQAEAEAKARGCKFCMLDTFSFQAPEFYKKYGYEELFVIEEHPVTGKHYFLKKALQKKEQMFLKT